MMKISATALYRHPGKIFAAADRGEAVTLERMGIEYLLTRKREGKGTLYGCLAGSIKKDSGKPRVTWKATR